MKKRLLITSIVMMLVVAVALSTATYAWFTSSARVTSSAISLTAASNSAASLGISWTDGNYGPSITAVSPTSGAFKPACPETLTNNTTLSTVDFYTASTYSSGGDMKFNADVTRLYTTEPNDWDQTHPEEDFVPDIYTWGDTNRVHQSFFVKNLSTANAIQKKINVTATITDVDTSDDVDAAALIRVGVFKKDGNNGYKLLGVLANNEATTYTAFSGTFGNGENDHYYKKVLGKYVLATAGTAPEVADGIADYTVGETAGAGFYTAANTATAAQAVYGQITAASSVNAQTTTACVTSIDITSNQGLAADTAIELVILVWEDGIALGDKEGGKAASIALSFDVGGALDPVPSGD